MPKHGLGADKLNENNGVVLEAFNTNLLTLDCRPESRALEYLDDVSLGSGWRSSFVIWHGAVLFWD